MKYLNFANHAQANGARETLMTLIDLSPSMDDEDWKPSRKAGAIAANKELLKNKFKNRPKDKMGIIGFSGNAKLLHPPVCLSNGIGSLRRSLNEDPVSGGTNFTAALKLARSCFSGNPCKSTGNFFLRALSGIFVESNSSSHEIPKDRNHLNRIIMLTDGEHNGYGCPEDEAQKLKDAGVIIDCIGIGGTPADVDEKLLKKIASQNPDGSIRYCFIGDKDSLIRKYETLATYIRPV